MLNQGIEATSLISLSRNPDAQKVVNIRFVMERGNDKDIKGKKV